MTRSTPSMPRSAARIAAVCVICCAAAGFARAADGHTWYVAAAAAPGGNGSAAQPFDSLATVQANSGPGDTIVVLGGPAPLDGGIALQPGQRLIGRSTPGSIAAVTNSTNANDGDAIRLATGNEVSDITVTGARRGGIYGTDVGVAVLTGNTVTGTNRDCHDGFIVQPFPPMLGVPFGRALPAAPDLVGLNNGWAGIMIDSGAGASTLTLERNTVRDTACGDGIDVRTSGTARVSATLTDNLTENINEGIAKLSVLAVGLQSTGASELTATLRGNTQQGIALPERDPLNALADGEGIFVNAAERARMRITIDRNTYRHGGGHFSANGLEYVTSNGTPDTEVRLTDSEFTDVPGDIVQNLNLSDEGARHSLIVDGLTASGSSFPGAALNPLVPGNLGSCLFSASFGRDNHTALELRDARLSRCSADGIGIYAYSPTGPNPATHEMRFTVAATAVSDVAVAALHVRTVGDLAALTGTVEDSRLAGPIALGRSDGTLGPGSVLDFTGRNCFAPGVAAELATPALPVRADNWPSC